MALMITLKISATTLTPSPTIVWAGNGYHIYVDFIHSSKSCSNMVSAPVIP
jgi:hypothetical protein